MEFFIYNQLQIFIKMEGVKMIKRILILISALLLILVGCSKESGHDEIKKLPSQKEVEFNHGEQKFKVIPFYKEVLDYTKKANEEPALNNNDLYNDTVTQPLREKITDNKLTLSTDLSNFLTTTRDVNRLEKYSKELLMKQNKINNAIKDALISSSKELSGGDKVVVVMPINPEVPIDDMNGVAAWTLSQNFILLQINPNFSEDQLKYTIAHEYHHTVNMEDSIGSSLLDFVVFEGKGDTFAKMIYPDIEVSWTQDVPEDLIMDALEQLKKHGSSFDQELYNEFMNGNATKNIPKWANYIIGYKIMQSYLIRNQNSTIKEWTALDPKKIIQGSEYKYLLESNN